MKICYFLSSLTLLALGVTNTSAATFTSNTASGDWDVAASWTVTGIDADGIPDPDDNVTIVAGNTIICNNNATNRCRDLNVNATGTLNIVLNKVLYVYGNYVMNGTETGSGAIAYVQGSGTSISGTGSFGSLVKYTFAANSNRTIQAGTNIGKNITVGIASTTVTNLGSFSVKDVFTQTGATFVNGPNGQLTIRWPGFMSGTGRVFNASAAGNTVTIQYSGAIPVPTGSIYENLRVANLCNANINTDIIVEGNFTLTGNANFNQNGNDLSVAGNISMGTGLLSQASGATLILNGSVAAQTVASVATATNALMNLQLNNTNGATFTSGTYSLTEVLTLSNGDLTINPAVNFTMLSNATNTCRIAEVTGSSSIIGNMTLQRFITGQSMGRDTTWADLASPVQASTFADWDNEILINYSPGFAGTAFTFDEVADDFVAVAGPGQALLPGQGYEMFLTDNFSLSSWSNTTLTTVGTPNVGDQVLSGMISFTPGNSNYNLVGNPFQSSIIWSEVFAASTNIANLFEYYDYTTGTYSVGGGTDELATGQGFWILTTSANPQLVVPESAKSTASNSTIRSSHVLPYMTLTVSSPGETWSHKLRIGAAANSTRAWDANDHPYHASPNHQAPAIYATTTDGAKAVIYAFEESLTEVVIPFTLKVGISGNYSFKADQLEFVSDFTCVTLVDKITGKTYDLYNRNQVTIEGLEAGKTYNNRFEIRMSGNNCEKTSVEDAAAYLDVYQNNTQTLVNFNFDTPRTVTINVTNALGQTLISPVSFEASQNTCVLQLPANYQGLYVVTVMNGLDVMTKKLIR